MGNLKNTYNGKSYLETCRLKKGHFITHSRLIGNRTRYLVNIATREYLLCYDTKFEDTRRNLEILDNIQSFLSNRTQCKRTLSFLKENRPFALSIEAYKPYQLAK